MKRRARFERADRCTKSDSANWERGLGGGWQVYGSDLTLLFSDVPCVLAVFIKTKQNAWDILKKGGKNSFLSGTPDFEKVKKNDGKIAKTAKTENPGRENGRKGRCLSKHF